MDVWVYTQSRTTTIVVSVLVSFQKKGGLNINLSSMVSMEGGDDVTKLYNNN